jgi:formylglycine-generating enzyme
MGQRVVLLQGGGSGRRRPWFGSLAVALALFIVTLNSAATPHYSTVPGAPLRSVLAPDESTVGVVVKSFRMRSLPVTNAEFLAFVTADPRWRRDRVPSTLAEAGYLSRWAAPLELGAAVGADQPVTQVSWFAAVQYCKSEQARLPTWHEWELAAIADETQPDARADRHWRERILSWYSRPSAGALTAVGQTPANYYGLRDLHGLVWEWVEDFNGVMISGDSREQGDPDLIKFCGAGAVQLKQRDDYPMLMRLALLSSLQGNYSMPNLGFRCVRALDHVNEGRR